MSQLQNAIQAFIDQLSECGVEHMVICPGSRNAPLIQAIVNSPLKYHSVVDERSAAFVALGMAQKLAQPTAVVCTSGTAAANMIPASIEAYYSGIPILILTADRPSELIDQWDGQCIRQNGLFSNHIAAEFSTPENYDQVETFQYIARKAYSRAYHPDGGPVHINIPLKEPLYTKSTLASESLDPITLSGLNSVTEDIATLHSELATYNKVLVFNACNFPSSNSQTYHGQIPVLSDILSNRKRLENVSFWDAALLNNPEGLEELQPELLITTGRSGVSKSLKLFLKKYKPKKHLHISLFHRIGDPFQSSPKHLCISEDDFWRELTTAKPSPEYRVKWDLLGKRMLNEVENLQQDSWNEFEAVEQVLNSLSPNSSLHLGNSMPVRYASFLLKREDLKIFGNRGTSGIDGSTSTAVGAAMVSNEKNTLISGDISFFYDINGLWQDELPANFFAVVLNNGGGEIFNLIDGPRTIPESLPLQVTPHQRSIKSTASEFGLNYFCAEDYMELEKALKAAINNQGPHLLEIKTNPNINKAFYERFKSIKL